VDPFLRVLQNKFSSDARLASRRELTKGNHFADQASIARRLFQNISRRESSTEEREESVGALCGGLGFLEGGSRPVVLVEYLPLVDAHDPVESDYEE
jgi:hypothetical protein